MREPVMFQFESYLSRIEIHSFLSDEQVKDAEERYGGKVALSHYTVPDLNTLRAAGYVPASELDALRAEVEALRRAVIALDVILFPDDDHDESEHARDIDNLISDLAAAMEKRGWMTDKAEALGAIAEAMDRAEALRKGPSVEELAEVLHQHLPGVLGGSAPWSTVGPVTRANYEDYARAVLRALGRDEA